jgi:hypothetical protein
MSKTTFCVLAAATVALWSVTLPVMMRGTGAGPAPTAPSPPPAQPLAPAPAATAPGPKAPCVLAFMREFLANEVLANDKYRGKSVDVEGCTAGIADGGERGVLVLLAHRHELTPPPGLICQFGPAERGRIAPLVPRRYVTVRGTCLGYVQGQLTLARCRVVAVRVETQDEVEGRMIEQTIRATERAPAPRYR